MMTIRAVYTYTVYESNNFRVARFKADSPVDLPDGNKARSVVVSGNCPVLKDVTYLLTGEFKERKSNGKTSYTFNLSSYEEELPSDKESIIAYLTTLNGVGKKTAREMFEWFTYSVFSVIENNPEELECVKGISKRKALQISSSFAERSCQKELFDYLYKFNVSESVITKAFFDLGKTALEKVKNNPYILTKYGISFFAADRIGKSQNIDELDQRRIKAAVLEVLKQSEQGGFLFGFDNDYPAFVYNKYLRKDIFNDLDREDSSVSGSTYLPYSLLYLKLLKLLDTPVSESDFRISLKNLLSEKRIFIEKRDKESEDAVFLSSTYNAEMNAARYIKEILDKPVIDIPNIMELIRTSERGLGYMLSFEQRNAVIGALLNPISIITGGPGTGKSSILKTIVDVYRWNNPKGNIRLASPTGQAAKRMYDVTSIPATTIHSLLRIRPDGEDFESYEYITNTLIIIDETSMIGSKLLSSLLSSVGEGSQIVFLGDSDQLPSVEVGCCLKEMIDSEIIPVMKLTQTFRQEKGSLISLNAAKIRMGQTDLLEGEEFSIIEKNSEELLPYISETYKDFVDEYGIDNVIVLSPYYKRSGTGVKSLNELLRAAVRPDIDDSTPSVLISGTTYYQGDRIMITHNQGDLVNGDVGYIDKIYHINEKPLLVCSFDSGVHEISGDSLYSIRLSFAQTIHKSQGLEYKIGLIVMNGSVSSFSKINSIETRELIYTAVSRFKQKCICVGTSVNSAISKTIRNEHTYYRRSLLGFFLKNFYQSSF